MTRVRSWLGQVNGFQNAREGPRARLKNAPSATCLCTTPMVRAPVASSPLTCRKSSTR